MNIKDLKPGTYTEIDPKTVAKVPAATSTAPVVAPPKLNIKNLPPNEVKPVTEPGFVQSVAQTVAKPFLKTASSVRDIYKNTKEAVKLIPAAAKDAIDIGIDPNRSFMDELKNLPAPAPATEYNYGYFGKQKPIGPTANILKSPLAPENVTAIKDAVGTGAELASYIPAGGAIATTGKGILARTIPKITTLAKEGAASGALAGFGTAMQENKGAVDTAIDTFGSAAAGAIGAPAIGVPLGAFGKAVTRQVGKIIDPEKEYRTVLTSHINKALGTLKKGGTLGSIPKTNDKKIQAFELMYDLAPNLKYVKNGEETTFDPKNVSPEDMAFALPKAKEYIYGIINKAKQEASGNGVKVNLTKAIDMVNEIASNASLGTSRSNAEKLSDDLVRIVDQNGDADIEAANQFAKDLNTRLAGLFNGTTDNLSREQEAMVSKEITDAIDHSMGTIFDTRFKSLQGQYSALKTIEDDVLRQYRKEVRQLDGVPQFIKDYGNAEILGGILNAATGNPGGLVKGLAIRFAGNKLAELRKPSTYLKKIFNEIDSFRNKKITPKPTSAIPKKKVISGVLGAGAAGGAASASASTNQNPEEVSQVTASLDSVYKNAESIAPMINKDYIKTLVQRESSNGTNDEHRDADQGKYGWLVGFTKPTFADIQAKAKTSQKYKNLIASLPGFDTPEDAMKSALIYSNFLLRDHTKEQKTGKREYKNITATELYKLYNGGGSASGVKAFDKEFGAIASNFPKKKYD